MMYATQIQTYLARLPAIRYRVYAANRMNVETPCSFVIPILNQDVIGWLYLLTPTKNFDSEIYQLRHLIFIHKKKFLHC